MLTHLIEHYGYKWYIYKLWERELHLEEKWKTYHSPASKENIVCN